MLWKRSNTVFFFTQGQVTLMWIIWSSWNSNLLGFMAVLVTCKFEDDSIKSDGAIRWTTFSPLQVWKFFSTLKASNSVRSGSQTHPRFYGCPVTCKFKDPIKNKDAILRTRSNMGFFGTKGQVTPKWIFQPGPNSNFAEILCLSWVSPSLMKIGTLG